jgi:hypothetical protein
MSKNYAVNEVLPSADMTALQFHNHDGNPGPGSCPPITDSGLSSASDSLKTRTNNYLSYLTCTAGVGLSIVVGTVGVSYRVKDNKGTAINFTGAVVNLTTLPGYVAGATGYLYLEVLSGGTATVRFASSDPAVASIQLCLFTSSASAVTGVFDQGSRRVEAPTVPIRIVNREGGNGSDLALNFSSGTTNIDGVRNYTSINCTGGTIYARSGILDLKVQGDVFLNCTVIVAPPVSGSKGLIGSLLAGMVIPDGGQGLGGSQGINIPGQQPYSIDSSLLGSGGAAGLIQSTAASNSVVQSFGGNGGGSFKLELLGNLTLGPAFRLFVEGGNATPALIQFNNVYTIVGGAGGGSGGGVDIKCYGTLSMSGSSLISVRGGSGERGAIASFPTLVGVLGGGGGGGGRVRIRASSYNFNTVTGVNSITTPGYITPWSTFNVTGTLPWPFYLNNASNTPPTSPSYTLDSARLNVNLAPGFNGVTLQTSTANPNVVGYGAGGVYNTTGANEIRLNSDNGFGVNTSFNTGISFSPFSGSAGASYGGIGAFLGTSGQPQYSPVVVSNGTIAQVISGGGTGTGTVDIGLLNQ